MLRHQIDKTRFPSTQRPWRDSKAARRSSVRRCGQHAGLQAPLRRGAREYVAAIRRGRAGSPRRTELAAIDADRAAEAAVDIEGRPGDRVAGEAWRDRLEIGDFPGRAAVGIAPSAHGFIARPLRPDNRGYRVAR
jgi:hypothetical protein